jgi:3-carboxy-cis,cis-muconate cycloisomerase
MQAAELIADACAGDFDIATLAREAAHAGTLAIPLVKYLRARVGERDAEAARMVHLGATSQDVADTALTLQAKSAAALLRRDLAEIATALEELARRHASLPVLGRTLLQGAVPITFGLRAAQWLLSIDRAAARFVRECEDAAALQFGGAGGSLESLGPRGPAVAARLAGLLGLAAPPAAWHARRDGIAGLGAALGIVTGSIGKIARDISLMAQPELGEAREPLEEGRGGSSAMAHKRNQTGCQIALSAALCAPGLVATLIATLPQEFERGLGGWQAEGRVLAELFALAQGASAAMIPVLKGLDVDANAMARNLAAAGMTGATEQAAMLARHILESRKAS